MASNNVRLKPRRDDSVLASPNSRKARTAERSPRELNKEANDNAARIERLDMMLARADGGSPQVRNAPLLRRRPHHRRALERRKSAALFMQAIILLVVLLAAVGWMNQRFHFFGE